MKLVKKAYKNEIKVKNRKLLLKVTTVTMSK